MVAALPIIVRVIAQVLAMVGITWFVFKLDRTGAADQIAGGVGDLASGIGHAGQGLGSAVQGAGRAAGGLLDFGNNPLVLVAIGLIAYVALKR